MVESNGLVDKISSSEEPIEDEECCLCNLNSGWLVFEPDLECVFSG